MHLHASMSGWWLPASLLDLSVGSRQCHGQPGRLHQVSLHRWFLLRRSVWSHGSTRLGELSGDTFVEHDAGIKAAL